MTSSNTINSNIISSQTSLKIPILTKKKENSLLDQKRNRININPENINNEIEQIETSNINVVISEELPQKNGEKLYSIMTVPSSSGLSIAKFILESIIIEK